jgi:hypothetical protein
MIHSTRSSTPPVPDWKYCTITGAIRLYGIIAWHEWQYRHMNILSMEKNLAVRSLDIR